MSRHTATVSWPAPGASGEFRRGRFSRVHEWAFDGGLTLTAAASPAVVPAPYTDAGAIDPEEALVAAVASCHMMSFLYVTNRAGFTVTHYHDAAVGELGANERGAQAIVRIILNPAVTIADHDRFSPAIGQALHDEAHALCFIANSVTSVITICPEWTR